MIDSDTIVALATPSFESAIALIRVSGPGASVLATDILGNCPRPRQAHHGRYKDQDGTQIDDVLFCFFKGPHSYTGEDILEISCHGNPFIAQKIIDDLLSRGCEMAEPGEFTRRSFLNGKMDLSQAEAVMDLIRARSDRALETANRQLRGVLGKRITLLAERLLQVVAGIEAYIDFPEEGLPPESQKKHIENIASVAKETNKLLATSHYGNIVRDGVRTILIGEPNAGKSSLLNQLVGYDRAIVSPEPGTTRDFLEERYMLGPHCIRFLDTAGLHSGARSIEKLGIEKTVEQSADADIFLLVLDSTHPPPSLPDEIRDRMTSQNTLLVCNKSDLNELKEIPEEYSPFTRIKTSALDGSGLPELQDAIITLVESGRTAIGEDLIAISARHAHALSEVSQCLQSAQERLESEEPLELVASDLRSSLDNLGQITGRIDNEQMLDTLFSSFCIGK
ncbi:MAG: tRNA uridine-5-carboxymethylaminomethyl(34) synthesis GTPase MnmE [Opitutaceae bacterium]|nr:tRNA uridine-5-carboxymethylaminomethyl(34) synthesis GTPase MnmE [Opitutaceae bacterium]